MKVVTVRVIGDILSSGDGTFWRKILFETVRASYEIELRWEMAYAAKVRATGYVF